MHMQTTNLCTAFIGFYERYQDSHHYRCAFWQLLALLFFFSFFLFFLMGHTSVFEFPFSVSCSKSTLTPVTTTWPRQRSRTNSCRRRRRRRRRRSRATTSPPRRTCPRGNLLWWPANWQADADATSAACNPSPSAPPCLWHHPYPDLAHRPAPPPPPTPPSRLAVTFESCSFLAFHRTCHDYLLYLFLFWPPDPLKSSYVSRLPGFISI